MTDAHCHLPHGETRHFLCSPLAGERAAQDVLFVGTHPWWIDTFDESRMREQLSADLRLGVGEIGLDRLRDRTISPRMREVFERQLRMAEEFRRPVVLHGAKCWGEVVKAVRGFAIPALLFHGFSRSDGLIPDIVALNGYISVGPALLNDHAVNYRELARRIPVERLLVESDRTPENAAEFPSVTVVAAKLAELRGMPTDELVAQLERNAERFLAALPGIEKPHREV